jgi:membrane protein implicated in regulation of membrane protease activity
MPQNQKNNDISFSELIISILLGIFITIFFINSNFVVGKTIQLEFDIVGVFNILITIILVIVVTRNLNKKDEIENKDKEHLINYFKNLDQDFTKKIREEAKDGVRLVHVSNVIKRHRIRANKIIDMSVKHNFLEKQSEEANLLNTNMKNILDLITETPSKGDVADGLEVDNEGKLSFSPKRMDQIISTLFDINSNIFDLMVKINHSVR